MKYYQRLAKGYTVVELMVTILIATILATSVGIMFAHLLTIQEKEREDAYVREKLTDICADYAEMLSVGHSFSTNQIGEIIAVYPMETGGISLEYGGNYETGSVVRVASLTSSVQRVTAVCDSTDLTQIPMTAIFLKANALDETGHYYQKFLPRMTGDAELLTVADTVITGCRLTRLITNGFECASMGLLEVSASYSYKDKRRVNVTTSATVRRVVRLWNGN